jgi:hypothetical protein
MDYQKLTADLKAAREQAAQVIEGIEDEGTCNLDHLRLYTGGDTIKRRTKKLVEAVEAAGCEIGADRHKGSYDLSLNIITGQAARRTRAMEAAYCYLRDQGWPITIYYVSD